MAENRHSRVFQEQPLLDILEAVFNDYRPMAAWRYTDEVGPFLASVRNRSCCVQYRETDTEFVKRLLSEEGIGAATNTAESLVGLYRLDCGHRIN